MASVLNSRAWTNIDEACFGSFRIVCANSQFAYVIKRTYAMAWRYEFYFLVLRPAFYHLKIKFISLRRVIFSIYWITKILSINQSLYHGFNRRSTSPRFNDCKLLYKYGKPQNYWNKKRRNIKRQNQMLKGYLTAILF